VKLLVVNPNTSASMTEAIRVAAVAAASAGTDVRAVHPLFGPEAIDSAMESYLSAVAVMDRVLGLTETFDAVVLAGFGEHGRDGLAELLDVPVFDIAECAAIVAQLLGRSYSVVTTLRRSVAAIEDRLRLAGLAGRCASVRACGLSTAAVDADPSAASAAILAEAARAVTDDHAEVICLGCGGMAGLAEAITAQLGVPVVDGVAAAVRLAEAVVGLGLSTSKVCTFATPEPNAITHWPLSPLLPGDLGAAR
jgi:allantoin racemase